MNSGDVEGISGSHCRFGGDGEKARDGAAVEFRETLGIPPHWSPYVPPLQISKISYYFVDIF